MLKFHPEQNAPESWIGLTNDWGRVTTDTISGLLKLGNDAEYVIHLGSPWLWFEATRVRMSNVNVDDVSQVQTCIILTKTYYYYTRLTASFPGKPG